MNRGEGEGKLSIRGILPFETRQQYRNKHSLGQIVEHLFDATGGSTPYFLSKPLSLKHQAIEAPARGSLLFCIQGIESQTR